VVKKKKKRTIDIVKYKIKRKFDLGDLGTVDFIIGIKFIKCEDGYIVHPLSYLNDILKRFKIDKYNEISNMMYTEDEKLRERKFEKNNLYASSWLSTILSYANQTGYKVRY